MRRESASSHSPNGRSRSPLFAARRCFVGRRSSRANAVLLDSIAAAFAGPALALRRLGVPVIAVLHQPPGGIDHGAVRERAQAPLDRLALAPSGPPDRGKRPPRGAVRRSGVPAVADSSRPPGTGRSASSSRSSAGPRNGRRAAFLTVANWLPQKGILELLEAFARLPADAGTLHLAGDEAADTTLRGARAVSPRRDRPHRPRRRARALAPRRSRPSTQQPTSSCFRLLASRTGRVWGEAMAFGLPVVGWQAGNLPHLAEDRREGLLVEPGDMDALSKALMQLALDADMRTRLGAAAKRRALSRPTWEASAALFFAAIREVVERGAATHEAETP